MLWPRGISKEKADIDVWLKDIAPSNELQKLPAKNLVEFPVRKRKRSRIKGDGSSC